MTDAPRDGLLAETDVLVVGGGIVGSSVAYFLAKEGAEVVLIDRDDLGTQGSGRNAGSLHLQLQSSILAGEHPERIRAREEILPFYREAVRFWHTLPAELGCDLAVKVKGGLMLAETEAEAAFVRNKVARERAQGIDSQYIEQAEVRRIAPYVSERIIAAEWCPEEGMASPLLAVPALARGAAARGARIFRRTALTALSAERQGFAAQTTRGRIRARRVVNACGPGANTIAAMLGVEFPVEGHCIQSSVTEAAEPFLPHLLYHASRILTLKQIETGQLIVGGGWPADVRGDGFQRVLYESVGNNMWVAGVVVPHVKALRILRLWAGIYVDVGPYAVLGDTPAVPGFFNCVTPDAGFTTGPLSGRLLAEAMSGRKPTFNISRFTLARCVEAAHRQKPH